MTTRQPSLIARLLYKAAQKGWIRLEQNSFLHRLMTLRYLLKFRLFSTLTQYSPSPYRAIWSLLTGQNRYLFYTSSSPQAQELRLSSNNLITLLRILKAGYPLVSADSTLNTLSIAIAPDLIVSLRSRDSYDVVCLNELLIEKEYGTAFPGYRILDVGAYNGDTPLFFAAHGAQKVIAAEPAPDNYALAQKNISGSPYADRIELLPVAVAATDGEMMFHIDPKNPQSNALFPTSENLASSTYTERLRVPVWSFAKLVAHSGWDTIDLVKLDCEGAEFPILLETPAEVLQKVKKWVIEYHAAPEPLEKRLQELGYHVQRVRDSVLTGLIWAEKTPSF
jgi:FkbM family methyltransferase